MRRLYGQNRLPGVSAKIDQLGPFQPLLDVSLQGKMEVIIQADSEDTGHTDHVKVLRAGLLVFKVLTGTSKGLWVPDDHSECPDANAVTEAAVLLETVDMRTMEDPDNTEDVGVNALWLGYVDEDKLFTTDPSYLVAFKAAATTIKVGKHIA